MTAHHIITDRDPDQGAPTDAATTRRAPTAASPAPVGPAGEAGPADAPRSCPVCGTSFTPSPRKPDHTYCRERCRATAWRHRRRDAARRVAELTAQRPATASSTTNTPTSRGRPVSHDVTNEDGTSRDANGNGNGDPNAVNVVQHCPHCRQPIAVITLILSPAAAHVTVPTPPPIPPTRRGRDG
jgi:predicted nucleic acid-binding Zn ribbon protein